MRVLDGIGRIVAWVGSLAVCMGVIVGSLFALFAVIGSEAPQAATSTYRHSAALAATPVLEANAFDVRKVAAFLAAPRAPSSALSPPPALEELRPTATADQPQPASLDFGTPDFVGSTAVNLRAEPSKNATRLATLAAGQPLRVVSTSGAWVQVVTPSGDTGWVYGKYLGGAADPEVLTELDVVSEAGPQNLALADLESAPRGSTVVFLPASPKARHTRGTDHPVSTSGPNGSPFWDYN